MSRRIDVDDALPAVAIPGRILDELRHYARETLPEECCGLILGDENERYQSVFRCTNDMNQRHQDEPESFPRDAKTAFWMREVDYQLAEKKAEEANLKITAVYHSHVGADAYLSDEDLEYADHDFFPFKEADQIVLGVPVPEEPGEGQPQVVEVGLKPRIGVFRRDGPGGAWQGYKCVAPGV